MLRSILLASVLATAAFTAGAHAQDDNSRAVSTRGVDFNNPSDVHTLYAHIRDAADQVCEGRESSGSMFAAKREKACEDDAVNNAVNTLNQPQLNQLAQHRSNGSQMAMRDTHDSDTHGTR